MKSPFSFQGTIARAPYLVASLAILFAPYLLQAAVFNALGKLPGVRPDPWYWFPVTWPGRPALAWVERNYEYLPLVPILLVLLAYVIAAWLLLALATRRARMAGRSLMRACLAIVPIIQIPVIIWLGCAMPSEAGEVPQDRVSPVAALKGLIAGLLLTLALVLLSTLVIHVYGLGLFLASPLFVGCVTAYMVNRNADIGSRATSRLVFGACFLAGVGLLAVAIEGIICLVMAMPLIMGVAWIGGLIGRAIALKRPGAAPGRTALSIAVLPLFFAIDLIAPPNFAFESVESIEVAATDQAVWNAITHMGPIPEPPIAPFRWGLAYPMSGSIHGSGVGAIREGVFSTGVAYERVTVWDPARRLSFIVLSDPPTMRELSPYRNVHAPHVSGYFRTLDARFTITPLANGHTQLSLATRHELALNPALYWLPMAKWAVHANKARVLAHFARQAENGGPGVP